MLRRLEENRLDLFLAVLEARDRMEVHARGVQALVALIEAELEAEKVENARLHLKLAQRE